MDKLDKTTTQYIQSIFEIAQQIEDKGEDFWEEHKHNEIIGYMCQKFKKGYRLDFQGMRERILKGGWNIE